MPVDSSPPDVAALADVLRPQVDLAGVRPLTVVVDATDGVAGRLIEAVLGAGAGSLPLTLVPLRLSPPGPDADPTADLGALTAAVGAHSADLGFAIGSDGASVVVVDENGAVVDPSVVATVIGLREVERERQAGAAPVVVVDVDASQAVLDLLTASGATVMRAPGGVLAVQAELAARAAVFGATQDAHYLFRGVPAAGSGTLAALHLLAAVGGQRVPVSAFAEVYQPYAGSGQVDCAVDDVAAARARVVAAYVTRSGAGPVTVDAPGDPGGLRAPGAVGAGEPLTVRHWDAAPRWWFTVRAGIGPAHVMLTVEAADDDIMEKVRDDVLALLRADAGPRSATKE